jgi:hypothetical protein
MLLFRMHRPMLIIALLLVAGAPSASYSQTPASGEMVWHWFGSCSDARTMTVDVTLSGNSLFKSSFPICLVHRSDKQTELSHGNLRFFFKAQARLFGDEFASLGTPDIEGNIWEAGSERDAILLGVSFMTKERILLNTIHVAGARNTTQAELATRLVMKSVVQPPMPKK